jgi:pyrimidine-nucleoside phosphorylase
VASYDEGTWPDLVPARLIERKREGGTLSHRELSGLFSGYLRGEVADYQMAAFLMAVFFRGMTRQELDALLDLMIHSGSVLDHSHLPGPAVDKHSTGGVGDKVSLVLAPLAAELGLFVPMMSGRGLGHTAGTLDKLEAIPGFRTDLGLDRFEAILAEVGVAMVGQSSEIAPLDRRLYALRDATATVPSLPLIAASIVSKKVAEGIQGLVLDVKTGAGAFLPVMEESEALARTMVELAEAKGVRTTALLTDMDTPLGSAIGNGLETREALHCLAGGGPDDLAELSASLVGEMLVLGGLETDPVEGQRRALHALAAGSAVDRMARLVEMQGGDPRVVEEPHRLAPAPLVGRQRAPEKGWVQGVRPRVLGHGVVDLGGGRRAMNDTVDPRVGFILEVAPGTRVEAGDPIGQVHASDKAGLARGKEVLAAAVVMGPEPPPPSGPVVRRRFPSAS